MATETVELTVVNRVLETPLIASSWGLVNEILSKNPYTKQPFETAMNLSHTANTLAATYAEPFVMKLAPIISQVDGFANKGLDLAEEAWPAAFEVTAEDLIEQLKKSPETVSKFALHTLEENKTRAIEYAEFVDSQFAPIVNVLDSNLPIPHDPIEADHQWERVLALLKLINDTLVAYSTEQFNHLKETNKLVANVTAMIELMSATAHDQYGRIHTMSEAWLADFLAQLEKLKELSLTLAAQAKEKAEIIPGTKPVFELFEGIAEDLTPVIVQISSIVTDSAPLQSKLHLLQAEFTDSVIPALESIKARLLAMVKL